MSTERYSDLDDYLRRSGESRRALAARIGVTPSAITLWRYRRRTPRPKEALLLSELTGISLETILRGSPSEAA